MAFEEAVADEVNRLTKRGAIHPSTTVAIKSPLGALQRLPIESLQDSDLVIHFARCVSIAEQASALYDHAVNTVLARSFDLEFLARLQKEPPEVKARFEELTHEARERIAGVLDSARADIENERTRYWSRTRELNEKDLKELGQAGRTPQARRTK